MNNKRTKCERYSRVVGYLRPIEQWNEGKQAEYDERVAFRVGILNEKEKVSSMQ